MNDSLPKIHQSNIAKHQMILNCCDNSPQLKSIVGDDVDIKSNPHPSVLGYENPNLHLESFGLTRKMARKHVKIAKIGEKYGQVPNHEFYFNFNTRDLSDLNISIDFLMIHNIVNLLITLYSILLKVISLESLKHPPPIRSSHIVDVNLTPHLLTSPSF